MTIQMQYEVILTTRNETFKHIAAQADLFIFFLLFHLSCIKLKLNEIHNPHQEKRGLSRPIGMRHFHAAMPIILLFYE